MSESIDKSISYIYFLESNGSSYFMVYNSSVPGGLLKCGEAVSVMIATSPLRDKVTNISSPDSVLVHSRHVCVHSRRELGPWFPESSIHASNGSSRRP